MKVLFISHQARNTGAPLALLQELRIVQNACVDIIPIVLLFEEGSLSDKFREICSVWVYNRWYMRLLRKLRLQSLFFRFQQIDCIYANTVATIGVANDIKGKSQIPIIAHIHESESLAKRYIPNCDGLVRVSKFISVSDFSANNLIDYYGVKKNQIIIQHPFSPWIEPFLENQLKVCDVNLGVSKDTFIIGCFCNVIWQKSPDLLPLVVNNLFKKYPDINCKFVIIGLDEKSDVLYHLKYDLYRLNILDKIIFVGNVNNPLDYHASFDVHLLLSREDSFPLVVEEAALLRKPTVGFKRATGAEEWIREECGIFVPYLDIDLLVEALYKMYSDEALRKKRGNAAYDAIKEMYEKEASLSNVLQTILCINDNV